MVVSRNPLYFDSVDNKELLPMAMIQYCCFVLWGEHCDAVAAVLFITNLRAAGIRVWIVRIGGKHVQGAHGLALVTDMALDEALPLAPQTIAVIIPCRVDQWVYFLTDPRLVRFLSDCVDNQAQLLTAKGRMPAEVLSHYRGRRSLRECLLFYPTGDTLQTFAHTFAATLQRGKPL